jgi:plastocyanin
MRPRRKPSYWRRGDTPGRKAILLVAALAVSCGGGSDETAQPPAAPVVANPVDPATAGIITGTVMLEGKAPAPQTVRTASDPNCTAPVTTEDIVPGTGGTLRNVFVYVKDGLGNRVFPVPTTPVVLAQEGCMYRPRVLGIQVGQTLEIVNGDETLHNIHAVPAKNAEFNKAQQTRGSRETHVFSTAEVLVPFKCDVHRWMNAYVGVVEHPFHAVSGDDGSFRIEGLPPGTYTIEAVHEKLGAQTQEVTVSPSGTATASFSFRI